LATIMKYMKLYSLYVYWILSVCQSDPKKCAHFIVSENTLICPFILSWFRATKVAMTKA
jgi:hypothetical protein